MPISNSLFSLDVIEKAKHRRQFDEALARAIEIKAEEMGVPIDREALLTTVKRRINAEIVVPLLDGADEGED